MLENRLLIQRMLIDFEAILEKLLPDVFSAGLITRKVYFLKLK